jgi:hypothetical protein
LVFGADQFVPNTGKGAACVVHELTHVVQRRGATEARVDRFEEKEHQTLGNIATANFPHFATIATDRVALRSSPSSHRPDDPSHNLVASLRKRARGGGRQHR